MLLLILFITTSLLIFSNAHGANAFALVSKRHQLMLTEQGYHSQAHSPPRSVSDNIKILETIEDATNSIGYVNIMELSNNTSMVFWIKINE